MDDTRLHATYICLASYVQLKQSYDVSRCRDSQVTFGYVYKKLNAPYIPDRVVQQKLGGAALPSLLLPLMLIPHPSSS